jgi:CO/xanthine dehydrogenase Mo-binding subunit
MAGRTDGATHIGRSTPRLEAWAKLTGRANYVHTLRLPGMLHGKIVRSPIAHGGSTRRRRARSRV